MKNNFLYFIFIFNLFCCTPPNSDYNHYSKMKELCSQYIYFIKNSEYIDNNILITLTEEVSENKKLKAFRISAQPAVLPCNVIPDAFDKVSGHFVVFFLKEKTGTKNNKYIKKQLKKIGIHSDDAYKITTNYPEWVLIMDSNGTFLKLITNAWYKPLNVLIELH